MPALTGILVHVYSPLKFSWVTKGTGIICALQTLFMYMALFLTRVSEERRPSYMKIVPELAYYSGWIACVGINVCVVILNIICLSTGASRNKEVRPFIIFTILV